MAVDKTSISYIRDFYLTTFCKNYDVTRSSVEGGFDAAALKCAEKKKKLSEMLGCDENGRCLLTAYSSTDSGNPKNKNSEFLFFYSLLKSAGLTTKDIIGDGVLSEQSIVEVVKSNRLADGRKIGRVLNKFLSDDNTISKDAIKKAIEFSEYSPKKDIMTAYQELTSANASNSGNSVILTTNFWDILACSELSSSNWGSCFRVGGGYALGPHHQAQNENCAMVYALSEKSGYKVFRAWVYFGDSGWSLDRVYGFISDEDKASLAIKINKHLTKVTGKLWISGVIDRKITHKVDGFYFDSGYTTIQGFPEGSDKKLSIRCGHSVCVGCGSVQVDLKNSKTQRSQFFCKKCKNELFKPCAQCGREDHRNHAVGDEFLCRDCLSSYAFKCSECGQYHMKKSASHYDIGVCDSCFEKKYSVCEACGELINSTGERLCKKCSQDSNVIKCSSCGKYTRRHINGLCISGGCSANAMVQAFF